LNAPDHKGLENQKVVAVKQNLCGLASDLLRDDPDHKGLEFQKMFIAVLQNLCGLGLHPQKKPNLLF
jgi:hypothetical protein